MDAYELRVELHFWHEKVCEYATEYTQAVDAEDFSRQLGTRVALDQAIAQVRHLKALLRLGVAA